MRAAGYVLSGSWSYGENISWRGTQGGPPPPVGPTVAQEHQDLFVDFTEPGRGHRLNLMFPDFREIGIGVETGVFTFNLKDYNAVMVTQDFGSTGANPGPFLLGVVYRDSNGDGFYSVGEGAAGINVVPADGSAYAISSASGGYAVPVTGLSGTVQVTFSGGPLPAPITRSVVLTGENIQLDLELNTANQPQLGFAAGTVKFTSGRFEVDLQGAGNTRVSVQASPDCATWTEVAQLTLTSATSHFTDSPATPPHRFYRLLKL
jgi:hypothetical protein